MLEWAEVGGSGFGVVGRPAGRSAGRRVAATESGSIPRRFGLSGARERRTPSPASPSGREDEPPRKTGSTAERRAAEKVPCPGRTGPAAPRGRANPPHNPPP